MDASPDAHRPEGFQDAVVRDSVEGFAQVEEHSSYTRTIVQWAVPILGSMEDCLLGRTR